MSDQEARDRAAHRYDENLVIVAGAGSGKTSLLVERLLCQMVERELAADAFAAITFTEKAAAEMRKRLEAGLARLVSRADPTQPPRPLEEKEEADRAYVWLRERVPIARMGEIAEARLHALAGMEITTIHGFCARLLRRYPREAGVDSDFQVDTGGRFSEWLDEAWESFLAGPEGLEGAPRARFARVLDSLGLGELAALARIAAGFDVSDDWLAGGLPDARRVFTTWTQAQLDRIQSLVSEPAAKGPESWLAGARRPLEALRDSGSGAFRSELKVATYESSTKGTCGLLDTGAPTSKKFPAAQALAGELHRRFGKLRQIDDELLGEALALVRPFARHVRDEARRRGILPFDALLALVKDLLATHSEIRRALAAQYRVLFLDEFQDTDPLQYQIVRLISEPPEGGAAAPGRLFIVGDPKQAIYRFRGADISAYESAVARVQQGGGARLVLSRNFRARPEILVPLDRLFQRTFERPDDDSTQSLAAAYVEYDGLEAARNAAGERRVERWTIGAAAGARDARALEAEVIASWVAREVGAKRFAFGDVALLFRALTDAHVYVRALQQRGISVWVGRADEPERDPALQQVTALLRALANPADAPAVLGFLRSPLGGVPDAELARHATRDGRRWLYTATLVDAATAPNLARAFESLARWHARAQAEPLSRVLAALREETPLLALHAAARDGVRRVVDLSALLDRLAARASAAPERDLGHFVAGLEREERRRSAEEPVPDDDAVRVLSIHGAKGLEFPVVVLPDLVRGSPPDFGDERGVDLRWSREQEALAVRTRAALSSTWVERERIERSHLDAEVRRLFYVAATRAQERLVFAQAVRTRGGGGKPSFADLLADWPVDEDVLHREIDAPFPEAAEIPPRATPSPLAALERAEAAAEIARAAARPPLSRPSGVSEADEEHASAGADLDDPLPPNVAAKIAAARQVGRAVGSALHEVLERLDFHDPAAARALLRAAVTRAARHSGAAESAVAVEAGEVLDALLASGLPAELASVEILGRELPLLFREPDGRAWSGTLDLLYRDGDGRLVVADYKTDRAPDADTRERYRAQLGVYARGVASLFPGEAPPELELVWLRSGQRERLPLESAT